MIRFEPVYYFHFKCNLRPLHAYPHLRRHTRDLLNLPKVRETVHLDHIVDHYYLAHRKINPYGTIPLGARVDLDGPDWCDPATEDARSC
jgi:putative glutathione S-transferase